MNSTRKTMKHDDYGVGWVCALPLELAAARGMLSEIHQSLPQQSNDENTYILGSIQGHNIAVACLPLGVYGTTSAAVVAAHMLTTFRAIRFVLMVGIGGGVPSKLNDIRLGDVVVSKPSGIFGGVIQYDYGKSLIEGGFERVGCLNKPPQILLTAASALQVEHSTESGKCQISNYVLQLQKSCSKPGQFQFNRGDQRYDFLYEADYDHAESQDTCDNCDKTKRVERISRPSSGPEVHYGLIASGNQVMKSGVMRDRIATMQTPSILCFEMEAAGLMDQVPCLVIRGICDYSDSHKNKTWQGYAAATAAGYAKALLSKVSISQVSEMPKPRPTIALSGSIDRFLGTSSSILAFLSTHSTHNIMPRVFKDTLVQLPLIVDIIEKIAADCRERVIRLEEQTKLLPVVTSCLGQAASLEKLAREIIATPEDSKLRRFRKLIARFRKEKLALASLNILEGYKSTLVLYLQERAKTTMWRCEIKRSASEWLKPSSISFIHDDNLPGTCEWIWGNPTFVKWCEPSPNPDRLLYVRGIPGCGKSVLATYIAKGLKKQGFKVLSFSFCSTDNNQQSLDSLFRAFIWQLLQKSFDDKVFDCIHKVPSQGLTASELFRTLLEVAKLVNETVYCIIDGVDEMRADGRGDYFSDLAEHVRGLIELKNLHIVLFGRPCALQVAIPSSLNIEMGPDLVQTDIEQFINFRINKHLILQTSRDRVLKVLLKGAGGMFLWVKLMIDDLQRSATKAELADRLCDIPEGMDNLYRAFFGKLKQKLDRREMIRARNYLAFTITACRILTVDEVQHFDALGASSDSTLGDLGEELLREPEKKILEVCGGFVKIVNGHVQLVHTSVKEFLTRSEDLWSHKDAEIVEFRVDIQETHISLASSCIRYLDAGRYEFPSVEIHDISDCETKYPILEYSSKYAIAHLVRSKMSLEPGMIAKCKRFIGSAKFVEWLEYTGVLLIEDPDAPILLEEFDELEIRLDNSARDTDVVESYQMLLQKALKHRMESRIREFGANDQRAEILQLLIDREQTPEADPQVDIEKATSIESPKNNSIAVSQIMNLIRKGGISSQFDKLNLFLKLAAHLGRARILTDPLKLLFDAILAIAPRIPVPVLYRIGDFYERVGKAVEALEVYYKALHKTECTKGVMRCYILRDIASILSDQGKYFNAEVMLRQAVEEAEEIRGQENLLTLQLVDGLGLALSNQRKYTEAERMLSRAMDGKQKYLGQHSSTATSIHRLAWVLLEQMRYPEAEEMYRSAMKMRQNVLGEHVDTYRSMHLLGHVLWCQGRYTEAEEMFQCALEGRQRLLGDHEDTFLAANNLGRGDRDCLETMRTRFSLQITWE
ncbi:hypothetical protein TWF730_008801 [Orbilia blumenaviensis]|uniref:Uncharacterized protein n=1 Tax=Orbilia blumenaviensis TaxID=1796055 RepID=A0AAV9V4N0_9PEZI